MTLDNLEHTDEDVVRQVLTGHTAMFELLMRRHNERVYRTARAIVRDSPRLRVSAVHENDGRGSDESSL